MNDATTTHFRFLAGAALSLLACSRGATDPSGQAGPGSTASSAPASPPAAASSSAPKTPEQAAKPAPRRPYNVLLVMIDSLRADMPWTGYERDIAPWLTRTQKSCVTYTRGYSLSSYTAKSVAPALVGEYPSAMKRDGFFFTKYPDEDNLFISERAQKAGFRTLAGHAHGYFLPALGNHQGFDDYRMIKGGVDLKAVTSVTGDKLSTLAKEMLSDPKNVALKPEQRFFAYFHYLDPHHTYVKHDGHPDFGSKARDVYDNEVHYTDKLLGELIDWTREQAWAKDTALIITSDHGEGFGENNHFRHAYELWEPLVKVPMIFCVPGAEPRRIEARRSHIDLAPTIADLMGLPSEPAFRGQSLVPEIFGAPTPERRIVVDLPRSDLMDRRRGVIADNFKIIAFGDDRSFKVYDLEKDPWEKTDLAKTVPETLERMKRIYLEESAKIPVVEIVGGAPLKGAPAGQRW
jgi:choline-sulfatase